MSDSIGLKRPILNGKVNFPLCLAPMVGLSHVGLRLIVRQYLPEGAFTVWPTEMLNSRRIKGETLGKTPETRRGPEEWGLVPQILGNNEDEIRSAVERLVDWGVAGIDINMGCPVKKALRHNYGVALMGDADYAAEVVRMTVRHSTVPVSVKLRAGHQNDRSFLLDFVQGLEGAGASWLCLHPRLAAQKRRGRADWEQIGLVRESVKVPVIGNGDIQVVDDVLDMLNQTGCDMVMAGRALTARPWLFWQLGERLGWPKPAGRTGAAPQSQEEEGAEYGHCLKLLLQLFREYFPEPLGVRKFRFYVRTSHVWLTFGHQLFSLVNRAKTYDELGQALDRFFAQPKAMVRKTDLRE